MALLGVVAHFIDENLAPKTILLALPHHSGTHHGINLADTFAEVVSYYNIQDKLGAFICDNASNNKTCGERLATEFGFRWQEWNIRCFGHVLNLIYRAVLDGKATGTHSSILKDPPFLTIS